MTLQRELNLPKPIQNLSHEAALAIVLTGDLLTKEADRLLRGFNLTGSQFDVLMLLRYQAGPEGISQTELSRMLLVNRANVTGLVDRMERNGLLTRWSHPSDRRVRMIRMTRKGVRLLDQAEGPYIERVEEIFGSLSERESKQLVRFLDRLRESLRG